MKVWLVQRAEPTPHDDGGARRLMRTGILGRMLAERGHSVIWWTSTFDHYNRHQRWDSDVRVPVRDGFSIQYIRAPAYGQNLSLARIRTGHRLARRFSHLVRKEQVPPDIILASLPDPALALSAVRLGRESGTPVVLDVRDLWPELLLEQVPRVLRGPARVALAPMARATRLACAGADAITGVTEAFVDWALEKAGRGRREGDRAFALGYMPPTEETDSPDEGDRFWDGLGVTRHPSRLIVAFFGTLGHLFDFAPVLEAARILGARNADVQFVICGDGESRPSLEKSARDIPGVVLPGWVSRAHIGTLLQRADVGLAPYVDSRNFADNIGNKVAEYLSGGLSIALSLDIGVLSRLLRQYDCGVSYGNHGEALADVLSDLLENPETLARRSANAARVFRDLFDGRVVYGNMISYLEEMSSRLKPGPHRSDS